ncbi:unnamed protein product [Blepharisma stoltei]|uniref:Enkurin domain-containing protein n=1 Tax=Blepharisma stoltei TaxID=1481888 RepID=A0AAU9KB18_9CILI|nr:unnamed protein product [Blepharisma stoltei]
MEYIKRQQSDEQEIRSNKLFPIVFSPSHSPASTRNSFFSITDFSVHTRRSSFIPFIHERGDTGKLLPPDPDPVILPRSLRVSPEPILRSNKKESPKGIAFLSTSNKTLPRTKRKRYNIPEPGYYNPKPAYEIGNKHSIYLSNTPTKRNQLEKRNALSTDYLDMDAIHEHLHGHHGTLSMDKQLARMKTKEDYDLDEKMLKSAKMELPEHLKQFKGLYHIGKISSQKVDNFPKNFMDVAKDLNENIAKRMDELKKIGKQMKVSAYK